MDQGSQPADELYTRTYEALDHASQSGLETLAQRVGMDLLGTIGDFRVDVSRWIANHSTPVPADASQPHAIGTAASVPQSNWGNTLGVIVYARMRTTGWHYSILWPSGHIPEYAAEYVHITGQ